MSKITQIVIDEHDAARYKKSLLAIQKRMQVTFYQTNDMSYRKWVNTHGPIIDELLEDLGHRFKK